MTRSIIASLLLGTATLCFAGVAGAHSVLSVNEGQAGHMFPMALNINHGCKTEPVTEVRLKIPEAIFETKASQKAGWTVEYKMRKLDKPVAQHGRQLTEVIDEIVWKNPVQPLPPDGWGSFEFRVKLPETAGQILYFKNISVCPNGTDAYMDVPKVPLDIKDPAFVEKAAAFMRATPGPAPMFIVRPAVGGQYPWEWTAAQVRGNAQVQQAISKGH